MSRSSWSSRSQQVPVRTKEEIALLQKSGEITSLVLKELKKRVVPGISLKELDQIAEKEILKLGGKPSFKTVPGYNWTTCLTVNDEVVHGIPRDNQLQDGDILGIDLGTIYEGWYSDAAISVLVGEEQNPREAQRKQRFLKAGQQALAEAIAQAIEGRKVGDISWAIQKNIEKAGLHVVRSLTGHGVGRSYHEDPEIPGIGIPGKGLLLREGMVLAIEAIYTDSSGEVYEKDDGWTIAALNGGLGGLFEMTVVVGKNKPEILTDWRD